MLFLIHDCFDDAVNRIENTFAGQVEIVGEDGERDLLATNGCGITGKRLDPAQLASLGINVRPPIKIREPIGEGTVNTGDRQRFPEARAPRLGCRVAQ